METTKPDVVEVIRDIRSGMDQASLMLKYGLSPKTIEDLFRKLIQSGLL
jgi:hypothetical protein